MPDFLLTNLELRALSNSIIISLGTGFFSVLISLFPAISIAFFGMPFKRIFTFMFLIPLLIPPYLHAFTWMHLVMFLGDNKLLGNYSCCGIEMMNSIPGIIAILTLAYFPVSFFIIYQALKNLPQTSIESASLNAPAGRVLRRIIIPGIIPAILTSGILTFIIAFITFDVPAFLGKNVFITQIFKSFTYTGEVPRAFYLSIIPLFIAAALWALLLILVKNKPFYSLHSFQINNGYILKKSKILTILLFSFMTLLLLLSTVIPIGVLQVKNILNESVPFVTASSTGVIVNTFLISIVSSIFLVIFSVLVYITIYKRPAGRLFYLSMLIIPPITFGILFIYLFNRPEFNLIYSTPIILIIAYGFRFSPLVCELLYVHTKQINPEYFEAAKLVSAPSLRRIRSVIFPLYKPALFTALMFGFWLIATELPITMLVQPPGFQTIITRLFIVLHYGAEELMSQLTLILIVISILPILATYFFMRTEKKL